MQDGVILIHEDAAIIAELEEIERQQTEQYEKHEAWTEQEEVNF